MGHATTKHYRCLGSDYTTPLADHRLLILQCNPSCQNLQWTLSACVHMHILSAPKWRQNKWAEYTFLHNYINGSTFQKMFEIDDEIKGMCKVWWNWVVMRDVFREMWWKVWLNMRWEMWWDMRRDGCEKRWEMWLEIREMWSDIGGERDVKRDAIRDERCEMGWERERETRWDDQCCLAGYIWWHWWVGIHLYILTGMVQRLHIQQDLSAHWSYPLITNRRVIVGSLRALL